ncbi:Uncharacterized protein APZ42_030157 [Daphnia magna]|uniref:Secreted protein n=1 Tax=Daphnia magna TaxID=35525 RepID=A0A164P0E0_9CRUS|nr:Uncharacterized protein APZ42_030157 [Daphnia magna]
MGILAMILCNIIGGYVLSTCISSNALARRGRDTPQLIYAVLNDGQQCRCQNLQTERSSFDRFSFESVAISRYKFHTIFF